jgi:hypothetical protein
MVKEEAFEVFDGLEGLEVDKALKIPLSDLLNSGTNTLTLLHSAARQKRMGLEVHADRDLLYVWNALVHSSRFRDSLRSPWSRQHCVS